MSDRIRNLEEGLQAIYLEHSHSDEPHPLMHSDLLGIKSTMGLYSSHSEDRPARGSQQLPPDQKLHDRSSSEDTLMVSEHPPNPVQVSEKSINPSKNKKTITDKPKSLSRKILQKHISKQRLHV